MVRLEGDVPLTLGLATRAERVTRWIQKRHAQLPKGVPDEPRAEGAPRRDDDAPKLELNKETLRDLDAPRDRADDVKGGGCGTGAGGSTSCCKALTATKKLN